VLAAAGISYKDFAKVEYLPYNESVELLKNRQIDVTLQSAGLGNPALRDLATSMDVVFIPIPPNVITDINDSAYQPGSIPSETYKGQAKGVPTATVSNFLVTHDGVSTETVYRMTKAMFENLDLLVAGHAAAKTVKLSNAPLALPVPLHPGAEKYYREVGVLK
jgi:hypothetical protein